MVAFNKKTGKEIWQTVREGDMLDGWKLVKLIGHGGWGQVYLANKGKEPHFALAAPIKPGKTIEDVKKSLKSESGPPPIIEDETVSTGIGFTFPVRTSAIRSRSSFRLPT